MDEVGERIGAGKEAEVFAYGPRVAKIYREGVREEVVRREAANIAVAVAQKLPVPTAYEVRQFGTRWGLIMNRAPGPPFADAMRAGPAPEHFAAMLELHLAIHARPGAGLASLKARLQSRIRNAGPLGPTRQQRLLEALAALPDGDRICHGDFHPFNIMGTPEAAMVIDWLDAASGPPAADVARSYVLLKPHLPALAESYVAAYAKAAGLAPDEIMRWVPVIAAARIAENVPAETDMLMAIANEVAHG